IPLIWVASNYTSGVSYIAVCKNQSPGVYSISGGYAFRKTNSFLYTVLSSSNQLPSFKSYNVSLAVYELPLPKQPTLMCGKPASDYVNCNGLGSLYCNANYCNSSVNLTSSAKSYLCNGANTKYLFMFDWQSDYITQLDNILNDILSQVPKSAQPYYTLAFVKPFTDSGIYAQLYSYLLLTTGVVPMPLSYLIYNQSAFSLVIGYGSTGVSGIRFCNVTKSANFNQSLAIIGLKNINTSQITTITQPVSPCWLGFCSNTFNYNYKVANASTDTIISLACGSPKNAGFCSNIAVPQGCQKLIDIEGNSSNANYGTTYVAFCNSQNPGIYNVSGSFVTVNDSASALSSITGQITEYEFNSIVSKSEPVQPNQPNQPNPVAPSSPSVINFYTGDAVCTPSPPSVYNWGCENSTGWVQASPSSSQVCNHLNYTEGSVSYCYTHGGLVYLCGGKTGWTLHLTEVGTNVSTVSPGNESFTLYQTNPKEIVISTNAPSSANEYFAGWQGSGAGNYTGPNITATIYMHASNITEKAIWLKHPPVYYTLTENCIPAGMCYDTPVAVSGSGSGKYLAGSQVTILSALTPQAPSNYGFAGWKGSGPGNYTGLSTFKTITMNGNIIENATWLPEYTLTINADNGTNCSITPIGAGTYLANATVKFSIPNYCGPNGFDGWYCTGTGCYSGTLNSSTVKMSSDITENALWEQILYNH
ncbi:MAG: InlB B-repeat-containing protein, partial [Candidatus Micrarchaeia archaeon]